MAYSETRIIGGITKMSVYIMPIKTAIITFPFLAMLFTLPFLIYQYRKYGYINYFRALILYTFLLYSITAYYLVILPLPKTRDVLSLQKAGTNYTQLIPFKFIMDISNETRVEISRPLTYIRLFKERAFLQAAFNGILLLPLGVYLRYYFNKSLKKCIIISFFTSLFFELTQLTGLYGYYNRPYRIFDVDDLMLNTLGGYLGYIISVMFIKILPNVNKLDESVNLDNITVSFIRRFLALAFDWTIFVIIAIISHWRFKAWIFVFLYFIVLQYFNNGRTFGKWLFRIEIVGKSEKLKIKEILVRYGVLYYLFFGANWLLIFNKNMTLVIGNISVYIFLLGILDIAAVFHVVKHFFSKDKTLFHDKVSGTRLKVIS